MCFELLFISPPSPLLAAGCSEISSLLIRLQYYDIVNAAVTDGRGRGWTAIAFYLYLWLSLCCSACYYHHPKLFLRLFVFLPPPPQET